MMAIGTLKSAAVLHQRMLARILKAPMSFFDTTPVGRIVNRFAKDIDVLDNTIPFMVRCVNNRQIIIWFPVSHMIRIFF